MKATELRIGNLLYYKSTNLLAKVQLVNAPKHFDCRDEHGSFTPNGEYEPIPITEEWLLKFGFSKIPHFTISNSLVKSVGRNRQLSVGCVGTPNEMLFLQEIDVDGKTINDLICLHNWDYDKELYIHKLQNLYHVLTGEELTINNNYKKPHAG